MHDGDVGLGWWVVMTLVMLVFWGGVVVVVVWALRSGASSSRVPSAPPADASAREILDRRLADGSIEVEEYERRRRLLDDAGSGPGSHRQPDILGGSA